VHLLENGEAHYYFDGEGLSKKICSHALIVAYFWKEAHWTLGI
jgi:hypothetical protein